MARRIAFIATVVVGCLGVMTSTGAANPPERSVTFEFNHHIFDFLAGSGQQCAFPVLGTWDATLKTVTFFDHATGNPIRVVTHLSFVGTLSNPATGKSVPDSGNSDKITDLYAPDGTFLKEVVIDVRDDPYLHAAVHFVIDANGNLIVDNGRDFFVVASHVIDIQPLCAALG